MALKGWQMENERAVEGEFGLLSRQFREFQAQMKDPLVVGAMLNQLGEERRSTNALLKEINVKLEKIFELEARLRELERRLSTKQVEAPAQQRAETPLQMLSSTDEKILEFVKQNRRACAEELQRQLNYKGRNAASSRLNALWKQGLLDKKYAGKVVYFALKQAS